MDALVTIGLSLVGLVVLAFPLLLAIGLGSQILTFRFIHLMKKKYPEKWQALQGKDAGDPTGLSQVLSARRYLRTVEADDPTDVAALKQKLLDFPKGSWRYFIIFTLLVDTAIILIGLNLMNS